MRWLAIDLEMEKLVLNINLVFHYYLAMKNVTITLDEEVAFWAKIKAAQKKTSVSRLVGELLRQKMLDEESYKLTMQQYLKQPPRSLKKQGEKYPRRENLYG